MSAFLGIAGATGLAAAAGAGFVVRPRPLAPPEPGRDTGEVVLPTDLPAPVAAYYRAVLAGRRRAPRIDTFTVWGRARMRRAPLLWLPVTFWSEHRVGWNGRQLLAVTWYGRPVLRAVDSYMDGRGELRIGRRAVTGHEIDQGENLFLWAEVGLLPSAVVTRPGVRWEPMDERSARLRVPFGDGEDELVFRFNPDTDLAEEAWGLRYRDVGGPKIGWRIGYERWAPLAVGAYPTRITVTWQDHGQPWFVLDVDGVAVNAPVSDQLTAPPTVAATGR